MTSPRRDTTIALNALWPARGFRPNPPSIQPPTSRNEVRVRLAHHTVERGKGIEVLVADSDEMEIFPSLKPNRLDRRNKTQKHSPLQIDELAEFAGGLISVIDAISELTDRMEPIFKADKKALADRIKQVKQRLSDLLWTKREFPQVAGG